MGAGRGSAAGGLRRAGASPGPGGWRTPRGGGRGVSGAPRERGPEGTGPVGAAPRPSPLPRLREAPGRFRWAPLPSHPDWAHGAASPSRSAPRRPGKDASAALHTPGPFATEGPVYCFPRASGQLGPARPGPRAAAHLGAARVALGDPSWALDPGETARVPGAGAADRGGTLPGTRPVLWAELAPGSAPTGPGEHRGLRAEPSRGAPRGGGGG